MKPPDSTCVLKAEPVKLDIKRRLPGILFISLQVGSLFKLEIIDVIIDFCAGDAFQKMQHHHDLI